MENGGNKKVNIIWEANLARAGGRKPTTGADLATRERYIRDKYERRKFYNPNALAEYQNSEPSFDDIGRGANAPVGFADFGPPADGQISDAAKLRAEKKKKKSVTRNKSFEGAAAKPKPAGDIGKKARPKKQEAAPEPVVDLLDLGGGGAPSPAATSTQANGDFADFFGATPNGSASPAGDPSSKQLSTRSRSKNRTDGRTKSKTPDREMTRKSQQQDILNMYGASAPMGGQVTGGGMAPNMAANPANMMAMMQQMQQMSMTPQQQQQMGMNMGMNPQQQQQQMQQPSGGQSKTNARLAMHQNLMVQQMQSQMQQNQNMQQQMQRMMQQQGQGMNPNNMQQQGGGMSPGMMNPQMMQAMMNANKNNNNNMMQGGGQGMPNAAMMGMNPNMMGMNPNMMMGMGMNPNMMPQQGQQPQMNQFGSVPMGGAPNMSGQNGNAAANNAAPEKKDPFAQFGMNAFR